MEREIPARPLLALRTLAVVDDRSHHVKTSVDIQMTSAIRTVSPASLHNGQAITALMTTALRPLPGPRMVPELGGGAVIVEGEPSRRLAMIHRRMPALAPGELALPLAALTAPPLRGDIPSDDPEVLRTKVFASAVSTLLGDVIAVLARQGLDPDRAWPRVAAVARPLGGPDVGHLFQATLPIKAMTAMRLADDSTADVWCRVPNPMAGLG